MIEIKCDNDKCQTVIGTDTIIYSMAVKEIRLKESKIRDIETFQLCSDCWDKIDANLVTKE